MVKRSCEGTWKLSTCQPRSQCFSLLFYLLFFRDWNAVFQYHTIQCLLIFCSTYHRQPSVCFTEASRLIIYSQSWQTKIKLDSEDNIILGGDLNCPVNPLFYKKRKIFTKRKLHVVTSCINSFQSKLDLVNILRIKHPDTISFTWS